MKVKDLPYFRWWVARAETDETYSTLTDQELGFYHRCLNKAWLNAGLPADPDALAKLMHVSRAYLDRVWVSVGKCWYTSGGRLYNRTQEEERSHATTKSERAAASVRTRYERRTDELLPRARKSRKSESESDTDPKTDTHQHPNGHADAAGFQSEYPLILEEIRHHDPAVDAMFVLRLVQETTQYCLSSPKFPQADMGDITDKSIAKACAESYATGPRTHGTGLLLRRVPHIIETWALEA